LASQGEAVGSAGERCKIAIHCFGQKTDHTCSVACLCYLLCCCGRYYSEEELRAGISEVCEDGNTVAQVALALHQLGACRACTAERGPRMPSGFLPTGTVSRSAEWHSRKETRAISIGGWEPPWRSTASSTWRSMPTSCGLPINHAESGPRARHHHSEDRRHESCLCRNGSTGSRRGFPEEGRACRCLKRKNSSGLEGLGLPGARGEQVARAPGR
jgi:hypothetical protein